jgi:nitrogen fixation/metabolism regulation signal transduction histidine kinase
VRYTLSVSLRVILLTTNIFLLVWIFGDSRLIFNQLVLGILLIGQVAALIRFVNRTNMELTRFLTAIRHQDFSATFHQPPLSRSFQSMQHSMNDIMDAYKQVKIEKEAQFHFLNMLVDQLQVGIIALVDNDVVLINSTAERLLEVQGIRNWKLIHQENPSLASEIDQLGGQNRKLIEVTNKQDTKILAVEVTTRTIMDQQNRLITLQDINDEIEQKEIEAWHKLIRILTHEIMNSITPIASLTETMQHMLVTSDGDEKHPEDIAQETIKDLRFALNTIQHRSEGLLHFVETYRKLSRVPTPVPEKTNVREFLVGVGKLMEETLHRENIKLNVAAENPHMVANFDPSQIEQVLINLITNSTHALEGRKDKQIRIRAYNDKDLCIIEVNDNGAGIPEKELKEIFVPFYSTKEKGSGIGLSLSKQILSLHHGNLNVTSKPGQGTSFYLRFQSV